MLRTYLFSYYDYLVVTFSMAYEDFKKLTAEQISS